MAICSMRIGAKENTRTMSERSKGMLERRCRKFRKRVKDKIVLGQGMV